MKIKYSNIVSMFLAILILLLLSVAIGMGGYIIVKMKEDEEEQEPESVPVPSKKGPQATKEAKETEPAPAPAPVPKKKPIDCVGSWSPWTDCTAKCNQDDGVRQRVFTVQRKAEHGGSPCSAGDKEKEMDACKASKGHYRNTGGCSKSCGGGEQRQDFILTTRGHDQGSSCPPATKYVRCNTHPCPVNCVGAWHRIRSRCRGGSSYEYRISRNAAHGGRGCPHRHGETKTVGRCVGH
ncbi:hypothetical protein MPWG_00199 [Micromonas pusilla virus PL1]|nr:hypothetical protein MPWG_00199 [Micromonas pusilla virus PL1]